MIKWIGVRSQYLDNSAPAVKLVETSSPARLPVTSTELANLICNASEHSVDPETICDNTVGEDLIPPKYGDGMLLINNY